MRIIGMTDKGIIRSENQDTFVHGQLAPDAVYAAVFDGMGGANAGKLASTMAGEMFEQAMQTAAPQAWQTDPESYMKELIGSINQSMFDRASGQYEYAGMGTTCAAVLLKDGEGVVANVGDSRVYLIDEDQCRQITRDHSVVAALVESGEISPEQAREHPQRNIITRALGTDGNLEVDAFPVIARGKRLLLCSDGLHGYFTPEQLRQIIMENPDKQAAKLLIEQACAQGGRDNITLVIINCT